MVNSARSLHTLAELSSVYVPISNKPSKLRYLSLDATSPWHISALQVVGVESMTLSSRLKVCNGGRGTLQDLEDTFNSTGKRRIAKLEFSVADPDVLSEKASGGATRAEKQGLTTSERTSSSDRDLSSFDTDVFTKDYKVATRGGRKEHVFGRAEASRGTWNLPDDERDPRDRFNQGPAVQRYVVAVSPVFTPPVSFF